MAAAVTAARVSFYVLAAATVLHRCSVVLRSAVILWCAVRGGMVSVLLLRRKRMTNRCGGRMPVIGAREVRMALLCGTCVLHLRGGRCPVP